MNIILNGNRVARDNFVSMPWYEWTGKPEEQLKEFCDEFGYEYPGMSFNIEWIVPTANDIAEMAGIITGSDDADEINSVALELVNTCFKLGSMGIQRKDDADDSSALKSIADGLCREFFGEV